MARNLSQLYTMADLEILSEEKNFKEFIPHAHDVRPGERSKKWADMFTNMLNLYLDDALTNDSIDRKTFKQIESYVTLPVAAKDIFIQGKRESVAAKYFKSCLSNYTNKLDCRREMTKFWHLGTLSSDMGLTMGHLLQSIDPNLEKPFWHYYKKAVKTDQSEFYCKRRHVKKAILTHLSKTIVGQNLAKISKKKIRNILSTDCWKVLESSLSAGLTSHKYNIKRLSYIALSSFRELKQEEKDLFATYFILDGPVNGYLFNIAWKTMEELGQNYTRRLKVLKKLRDAPVLPDKVFRSFRPKKKRVLANFIANYFPEYVEYYAGTCLDYLEGKKKFSKGNPTISCHDLFKLGIGQTWPSVTSKKRYISLPKL